MTLAARILERLPEGRPPPPGRVQIGFMEADGGREAWTGVQMDLGTTTAVHAPRPYLTPLVRLLDEGGPFGVVAARSNGSGCSSGSWAGSEELDGWELEITSLDWRERKAPQRNPQAGDRDDRRRTRPVQGTPRPQPPCVPEAGRGTDRPPLRRSPVEAHRRLRRGRPPQLLAKGLGRRTELVHAVPHDLIGVAGGEASGSAPPRRSSTSTGSASSGSSSEIEEAIGAEPGAAVGQDEVLRALEMAQARHVIFDPDHDFEPVDGLPGGERFVALALGTGAEVTPTDGPAAASLGRRGGVAALLRFGLPSPQ